VWLLARSLDLLVIWLIGPAMLGWAQLPAVWRSRLALLASGGGLLFLVLAINSEGLRQAPTMAVVLLGTPYVTGHVSASASLPYYLLTAVCLLMGTLGLGLGDEMAAFLRRRFFLAALLISALVTALRFLLEKSAAPLSWTQGVGLFWLTPLVGAYFTLSLRDAGKGMRDVMRALTAYAFAVRGAVTLLVAVATRWRLGSHYDVSRLVRVRVPLSGILLELEPGSVKQFLVLGVVPQLLVWPVYTIVAGWLGAWLTRRLLQGGRPPLALEPAPLPMAPSPDARRAS
jgi:hypothetical protein